MNETLLSRATDKELIKVLAERMQKADPDIKLHEVAGGSMLLQNQKTLTVILEFEPNGSFRTVHAR